MKSLAFAAGLALVLAAHAARAQEAEQVIEEADFVLSNAWRAPPPSAPWERVRLPDNWYLTHPGPARVGWYRLTFELSARQARINHALYLPRNSAARMMFFLGDGWRSTSRWYGDPGSANWAPPLLHSFSPGFQKPGLNVLYVRVEAMPEMRQGLTRVTVVQGLEGRVFYERRYATQVTTLFMFGAAAFFCGLLAAVFWLRERSDPTLLWFAITAFAWAIAAFPWFHAAFTPQAFFHGPLAFAVRFAYAAPMLVLCLRVAGKRWSLGEPMLWFFTLCGVSLAWLLDEDYHGAVITYWSMAYLAALVAVLAVVIRSQQGRRWWAFWPLIAALVLAVLLNAHDFAWWMGWIDYESFQLAHFHIPLVLFAVGATIIDRHFQAVAAVERAKVELEGRVAQKAREIEANYARVQEAEHEKALARERQRIMSDMHDGLGSTLVGLLGAVQSGTTSLPEVEKRLHDALQEMRLAVDALDPTDGDLGVILGNVRHRMRTAIESSGVQFHWQVEELPQLPSLTPAAVMDIQRIVLEAMTNSLRHGRAADLTVSTRLNGSALHIGIADNGVGFDPALAGRGRGLESLRRRARALGATVDVQSAPGAGTHVILHLPLATG
jgi:signal transduction histidine kinase